MSFAAPIALLLLLPWLALVWWLMRGRGTAVVVPHLPLWPATRSASRARSRRMPPWPIVLALLGLLAAILGVAGPRVGAPQVTLVIDNGLTMSPARLSAAWDQLAAAPGAARWEPPPGASVPWQRDLSSVASASSTLFITDQPIDAPRVPMAAIENVGIEHVGVDADAVLVRLRGNGTRRVRFGDVVATVDVAGSAEVVLETSVAGDRMAVVLEPADAISADDRFFLVRTGATPRVMADDSVPAAVRRFAAVWSAQRGGSGPSVLLTTDPDAPAPAVIFASGPFEPVAGEVQVVPDDLTRDIDWPAWLRGQSVGTMPAEFDAVVRAGPSAVVGRSAGRVWIGLEAESAAREAAWVVLLANAVEQVGGAVGWTWQPIVAEPMGVLVTDADPNYQPSPGIYELGGEARAYNAAVAEPRAVPGPLVLPAGSWVGVEYRTWSLAVAAGLWLAGLAGLWRVGRP